MDFNLTGIPAASSNNPDGIENVVILGAGPAGMSAALYAARADLNPLVITGMELGGQAALTYIIENYPGFPEGVGGMQLGELFQKQAERFGARFEFDVASEVNLSSRPFRIKTYGKEIQAKTLIVATGASPVHLRIPGETELTGKGVSYCATCDGWFFKDKKVAVVGGGDSAVEEGLFLTRFASTVNIIHRRDELRAGAILQDRAKKSEKIRFTWDTVIKEIRGKDAVEEIVLQNLKTGEERVEAVDGVFIFIGHKPNTQIFGGQLEMDSLGYISTDMQMRTNIAGVFAAGEIADPHYRQVVTSAGMGAAAAIQATRFLEQGEV
ncbi:MAG: thioredoxin-disulfide reductase [Anaerolineaceae bacterium]|nr:thioredoxin-disulfide reductase [Anaerolineaceae bacterium]